LYPNAPPAKTKRRVEDMDLSMIRPEVFTWSVVLLFVIGALWGWTIYIYLMLKKKYAEQSKGKRSVEELIKELKEHMASKKDKEAILALLNELKSEAKEEKHEAIERIMTKVLKDEVDDEIDHLLVELEHGLEAFRDEPPMPEPAAKETPAPEQSAEPSPEPPAEPTPAPEPQAEDEPAAEEEKQE
jgi:hypothetical protein